MSRTTTAPAPTTNTTASYAAMYNAFISALGGSATNFQLITPFTVWNWPPNNPGQTSSQQQSFLDAMPYYSPIGKYLSGSSFSSAYQTWLNTLVVQAPATLQNQITLQQGVLQTATNKYQLDLTAAQAAYKSDSTVVNNVPDFTTWLGGNGFSYGITLQSDKSNVLQQQKILNQLINQAADPIVDAAQAAMANTTYYTNEVSSTLPAPISVPGYGDIGTFGDWVTQQAGTSPTTITWGNSQSSTQFNSSWAQAEAQVSDPFFSIYVGGSWVQMSSMESDADVSVEMTFNPLGSIAVSPAPWYQEATVRAKVNTASAYRPGYTPTQAEGGPGYVLGAGGIMPCRMTNMIVGYQPSFTISSSSSFSQSEYQEIQVATGVRIGPFTFGGDGGHISSYTKGETSSNSFSGTSTSQFPMIVGINVEDFSQV